MNLKDARKEFETNMKEIITDFNNDIDDVIEKKDDRIKELEDFSDYDNVEDIYLSSDEKLQWKCNNLAVQGMMEVLVEKLKKHGPLKLENLLTSLP